MKAANFEIQNRSKSKKYIYYDFWLPIFTFFFLQLFLNSFLEKGFDEQCREFDILVRFHRESFGIWYICFFGRIFGCVVKQIMFYSKSKEKIYACECKVVMEFLKKLKLKNFKILYALQKGRNIVRSFVKTPLFLLP